MSKIRSRRGLPAALAMVLVVGSLLTFSAAPSSATDDGPQPGAEYVSIVMRGGVQVLADVGPYRFGNPPHTGVYLKSIRASVYEDFDTKLAGVKIDIFSGAGLPSASTVSITTSSTGNA